MKIYVDTADLEEIQESKKWGIIDGVTTNLSSPPCTQRRGMEKVDSLALPVDGDVLNHLRVLQSPAYHARVDQLNGAPDVVMDAAQRLWTSRQAGEIMIVETDTAPISIEVGIVETA